MPTIFTHAIAASAIGSAYPLRRLPRGFWLWTMICSIVPDADVVGFGFGVNYGDVLGHRGFTHSLVFAAILGTAVAGAVTWTSGGGGVRPGRRGGGFWSLAVYFAVVTASHGLLDALTDGGLGIAFFAPLDNTRLFFPWTPIEVSPIGRGFFSARGLSVLLSEAGWVWLPSAVVAAIGRIAHGRRAEAGTAGKPSD